MGAKMEPYQVSSFAAFDHALGPVFLECVNLANVSGHPEMTHFGPRRRTALLKMVKKGLQNADIFE